MNEKEDKAPPPGKNTPPPDKKPAGRLETVGDVKAAIAALLQRLKQLQGRRGGGKPPDEEETEKRWPADLNAPAEESARG